MKVLVIDVGGSDVKLLLSGEDIPRKFESGPKLAAESMVKKTKEIAADWEYEAVSISGQTLILWPTHWSFGAPGSFWWSSRHSGSDFIEQSARPRWKATATIQHPAY